MWGYQTLADLFPRPLTELGIQPDPGQGLGGQTYMTLEWEGQSQSEPVSRLKQHRKFCYHNLVDLFLISKGLFS